MPPAHEDLSPATLKTTDMNDSTDTPAERPTIVLIHGAWHWGGCFGKVADLLGAHGFPVITPDLKSHGYSAAGYADVQTMDDYAEPVARLLEAASRPLVLLGHSMGGATLTHLGERYPDKIAQLIYLTAFMTRAGKSPNDYIFAPAYGADPAVAELFQLLAPSADGKGVVLDVSKPALVRAAFYADCSDRDFAVASANVVPINTGVPYGTPSQATAERFGRVPRLYIECMADKAIPIAIQRQMQADVPGAKVVSLQTSHSPFFSAPAALASLIVENLP
jgi:pimeloyl-ACP methyl ester carboxylesterase